MGLLYIDPVVGHHLRATYALAISLKSREVLGPSPPREGGLMMGRRLWSRLGRLCGEQENAKHDGAMLILLTMQAIYAVY